MPARGPGTLQAGALFRIDDFNQKRVFATGTLQMVRFTPTDQIAACVQALIVDLALGCLFGNNFAFPAKRTLHGQLLLEFSNTPLDEFIHILPNGLWLARGWVTNHRTDGRICDRFGGWQR